jgi:hypothetical protein
LSTLPATRLYEAIISALPSDTCHPTAKPSDYQTKQRQAEWLPGVLEIQSQENPIYERYEQASEEPPNTPVVGNHQESDLPIDGNDQTENQKNVTDSHHFENLL